MSQLLGQTQAATCPICDAGCDPGDDLRFHLHTRHRKSAIIETYLETVTDPDAYTTEQNG